MGKKIEKPLVNAMEGKFCRECKSLAISEPNAIGRCKVTKRPVAPRRGACEKFSPKA